MKIKTKMDKIKAVIQNNILKTKHFFKMVVNKLQEIHKDNQEKKNENKDGTVDLSNIEKENTEYVISKLKKINLTT